LPFKTPVTVVESVIAGVVDAFATVPASPFAETTETVVTEPPPLPVAVNVIFDPDGVIVIPLPATRVRAPVKLFKLETPPPDPEP
jgi:hypothetical protein